ncbi:MAG TPA: hypothetical protein VLK03_02550 [Nocardioides sp.]|nr:hypothetical protein [Nocardioides sp.]
MQQQAPYDDLVARLQALRAEAGLPSFGDIATSVSRVRRDRGMTVEQSRVGRTTVYDAFRMGRQRIDADLVGDIARALGAGEELASDLTARARLARGGVAGAAAVPTSPSPDTEPAPDPAPGPDPRRTRPTTGRVVAILLAGLLLNMTGWGVTELLDLPVYLDMLGTAFAAIALGPWWGVLVGVATNVAGTSVSGHESLLFAPVNAAGALVWGYGVRRWRLGRSIPHFFGLSLVVAVVCTAVAVPIIAGPLGGFSESGVDDITSSVLLITQSLWISVTVSNLISSITDKLIAGFVALTLVEVLPASARGWTPTTWLSGAVPPGTAVRGCSGSPRAVRTPSGP